MIILPVAGPRLALYDLRMEPDDYRRASFETWEAMAPGWERWRAALEATSSPVR